MDEIFQDIEDICLELKDDGFSYYLNKNYSFDVAFLEIRKGTGFKWPEIEDVVQRLKSYLISMGYNFKYDARKVNDTYVLFKTDEIYLYKIFIKK